MRADALTVTVTVTVTLALALTLTLTLTITLHLAHDYVERVALLALDLVRVRG